jgi:hypothetical protein
MLVKKLKEAGYEESALGFSLSYNSTIKRAMEIMPKYAFGKPGESKFLESIFVWLDVDASRTTWSEMDTYRISTKQSESTMHTLGKRHLTQEDFEYPIPEEMLAIVNYHIDKYKNKEIKKYQLKNILPEGFLQRIIWCFSYKTLQNIYSQRFDHELPQWHIFLDTIIQSIDHPEFIVRNYGEENNKKITTD